MGNFHVLDHPLIQHKLTMIRQKDCGTKVFREVVNEISMLMAYEVSDSILSPPGVLFAFPSRYWFTIGR